MWVTAEYEASSLFSLKSSLATSSAGKTLLVPTPFTLKMALLDIAIRTRGLAQGKLDFDWLRDMNIALRPAERALVTNLFAKIQKPRRTDKKAEEKKKDENGNEIVEEVESEGETEEGAGPFGPTIAYREYVHLQGRLGLAFEVQPTLLTQDAPAILADLLVQLNYLGKRGGFFQLVTLPEQVESVPVSYVTITSAGGSVPFPGLLQVLDDCGPELSFEKADIYSDKKIRLGKERTLRSIVLPYQLVRSSRSYSLYQRLD